MIKSWSEVTLRKYKDLYNLLKTDWSDELTMNLALISLLADTDAENLEVNVLAEHLKDLEFISNKYQPKTPEQYYTINGKEYEVFFNVNKMTAAQYIDFQNFYKTYENSTANLAACFLLPKGHKYGDDYDPLEEAEFLNDNLTIDIFSDVMFFFVKLLRTSTMSSLISSEKEMKEMLKKTEDPAERKKILRSLIQTRQLQLLLKNEAELSE